MKNIISKTYLFIFPIILLLWVPNLSLCQISPSIEWQRCIGGFDIEDVQQAIPTRDGGYILVSVSYSYDGDVHNASPNTFNGWVVKLNPEGQIEWSRSVEGDNISGLHSVIEATDGSFILVGFTKSLYIGGIKTHGQSDALVIKLNKDGVIIWQKTYGGSGFDNAYSVVERNREGGGYIFGGETSSTDGDLIARDSGKGTAWIVAINQSGDIEWQKYLGGSKEETITSIVETKDGGIVFTGTTSSNDGDLVGHNNDLEQGWLVKLNASGNILWQKFFKADFRTFNFASRPIIKTSDSGFTLAGSVTLFDSSIKGYHNSKDLFGNSDVYVAHLNSSGTVLWERCYGGIMDDRGNGICTTSDGGYLVIGTTSSNNGDVVGNHQSSDPFTFKYEDAWVVKLTSEGNVEWQHCYGGDKDESGNSIIQTSDGKILFVAGASSLDGDVYGIHSNGIYNRIDIWVVKLGVNAGVSDASNFDFTGLIRDKFLKIYPNPSSSSVRLEMLSWFTAKGVEIYNLLGTKITCETTLAENGANVNVKSLPNGTYIARVAYTSEKVNGTFTLPLIVYH